MSKNTFNSTEDLKNSALKVMETLARHRLIIIIIVASGALALALVQTGSFINIPRDEDKYNEGIVQINYKKIDEAILDEFKDAGLDGTPSVNSNFQSGRDNPFTE